MPDDKHVVAYGRGTYCVLAHDPARLRHRHGRQARRLVDGMLAWRLADLPAAT